MCGSMLAPKPPKMPSAPAPVAMTEEEKMAEVQNPEPVFIPGSEVDELDAMASNKGTSNLKTHSKTDTGLAIPIV